MTTRIFDCLFLAQNNISQSCTDDAPRAAWHHVSGGLMAEKVLYTVGVYKEIILVNSAFTIHGLLMK